MSGFYSLYQSLKSTKLALGCGLMATFLLVVGSFVMNFNPAVYSLLQGEDISFFFKEFNLLHLWFYLLILVLGLFGLNTLLCSLHALTQLIKLRVKELSCHGPLLIHTAFLMALLGHLVAGLGSYSSPHVMVGKKWVDVDESKVRLVELNYQTFPDGLPKKAIVSLQINHKNQIKDVEIGFNDPHLWERGSKLLLFHRPGYVAEGVWIKSGNENAPILLGEIAQMAGLQIRLDQLFLPPSYKRPAAALAFNHSKDGGNWRSTIIPIGGIQKEPITGKEVQFLNLVGSEGVMLSIKTNPSILLVLLAMGLFLTGVTLVLKGRWTFQNSPANMTS